MVANDDHFLLRWTEIPDAQWIHQSWIRRETYTEHQVPLSPGLWDLYKREEVLFYFDAWNGFHSFDLKKKSRPSTFTTPWDAYQYKKFPQGRLASSNTYPKMFDDIQRNTKDFVKFLEDVLLLVQQWVHFQPWKVFVYLRYGGPCGVCGHHRLGKVVTQHVESH